MVTKDSLFAFLGRKRVGHARYSDRHPHFIRNIAIDAVVSTLAIISLGSIINHASANSRVEMLRKSGAITMTAEELVEHVKQEKLTVYWLGPIQGDDYTIICTDPGEIYVNYIPSGARLHDSFASSVMVETYAKGKDEISALGDGPHSESREREFMNPEKSEIKTPAPIFQEIAIPGTGDRVEIHYPTWSASVDPRMQADRLKRIG